MNHYEELGLPRTATPEQIHRAYRTLSLLLHPDRQTDPELAKLAELQMQRLNEIYRTLTDEDRRIRYDLNLSSSALARRSSRGELWRKCFTQACWYVGAAAGVAVISWYISGERLRSAQSVVANSAPEEIHSGASLASNRKAPRSRVGTSRPSVPAVEPVPVQLPSTLRNSSGESAADKSFQVPEPAPVDSTGPEPLLQFEGTWFYAPPATQKMAQVHNFYAPQFIEAVIRENGSRISGRYSARYNIPDQAISPDVLFRFEGTLDDQQAVLTWSGEGGSKGDARIRLLANNRMELQWSAAKLGQQLGLSEGRAVLVRASPR